MSESAFFSMSEVDLAHLREEKSASAKRVIKLMLNSQHFLLSIYLGNLLSIAFAATTCIAFFVRLTREYQFMNSYYLILALVVLVGSSVLVISRIPAKILSVRNPKSVSLRLSLFSYLGYLLFYPLASLVSNFTKLTAKILKIEGDPFSLSQEKVKSMIEMGEEEGKIHIEEKEMIHSIFEFGETTVKEIMVPRIDMVCLEINSSVDDLIRITGEKGHSRIPIYEGRVDNIKGIIHVKNLIPELASNKDVKLQRLSRPAFFVPESKKIDDLLSELKKEKIHMAIVVDEYGGTAGLVTLEDIIEEIVGEIQDEYDKELPLYREISEGTFMVDGRISIDELNEVLPEPILQTEEEDFETLAGLIYHITESIPNMNEQVTYLNYDFVIEEVVRQRIKKVRVIHKIDTGKKENQVKEES